MKITTVLLILSFFSFSCSNKQKSRSSFRLLIGSLTASIDGGAFVGVTEINTNINTLYKLDSTQSILIPYGTYNLLFITFSGPLANTGEVMCGALENTTFNSQDISLNININANECTLPKYSTIILSLKQNIVSIWGTDKWDLSQWGQ